MRQVRARTPVVLPVLCALVLPVQLLRADAGAELRTALLAGIAGGDYGVLKSGRRYRLELCLVYRREYFGFIGNYYVYIMSVR